MSNPNLELQLKRYKIIDNLISSGVFPSVNRLVKETGSSEATFYRDLQTLKDKYNAPIEFSKEKNGYFYAKEFNLLLNSLSESQLKFLAIAKKILLSNESKSVYEESANILEKLFPSINMSKILERICVPKRAKPLYDKEVFEKIFYSIENNLKIEFIYKSKWEPDERNRKILPYQIVLDDGQIYLFGCSDSDSSKTRLFNICRIQNIVVTKEKFTLPENYDFEFIEEKGRFGAFEYDEVFDFEIEFFGDARIWIRECVFVDNQKIQELEDKSVMTFTSGQWIPIEKWLLAFGHLARPIKPTWLVQFWQTEIDLMKCRSNNQDNLRESLFGQRTEEL